MASMQTLAAVMVMTGKYQSRLAPCEMQPIETLQAGESYSAASVNVSPD